MFQYCCNQTKSQIMEGMRLEISLEATLFHIPMLKKSLLGQAAQGCPS